MVSLGWKELFSDLQVCEVYNLNKFEKYISSLVEPVTSLDFSGIDLLTDEVLYVLTKTAKTGLKQLQSFSCVGCIHVTDHGVWMIATTFPALQQVYLDGCHLVTSRSIHHLEHHCQKLQHLSMIGTSVTRVPPGNTAYTLICDGCPVVFPSQTESGVYSDNTDEKRSSEVKVVILGKDLPDSRSVGLTELLTKGEVDVSLKLPLSRFQANVTSSWDATLSFNVFEMSSKMVLCNPFITDKAVYIIPFMADLEDHMMNTELDIITAINTVRSNILHASFVVVIMYSKQSDNVNERIKRLIQDIQYIIDQQKENLMRSLGKEEWKSPVVKQKDLLWQIRYGRSLAAAEKKISCHFVKFNLESKEMDCLFDGGKSRDEIMLLKKDAEEALVSWRENYYDNAMVMVHGINKSDFSEVKSYASPPARVLVVFQAVGILFDIKDISWAGVKRLLSDHMFIKKIYDFDVQSVKPAQIRALKKYRENEDVTTENLLKINMAAAAMWTWVVAVYEYHVSVAEKVQQHQQVEKNLGVREDGETMTHSKGPEAFYSALKDAVYETRGAYHEENVRFPKQAEDIINALPAKKNICSLKSVIEMLPPNLQCFSWEYYIELMKQLHEMGKILFFPESTDQFVIFNIPLFVNLLHDLHQVKGHENKSQCPALPDETTLLSRGIIHSELLKEFSDAEVSQLVDILMHLGILIDVPARIPSTNHVTGQLIPFLHLPEKAIFRMKDKIIPSTNRFMINNWADYKSANYNKADLQITYFYKFPQGLPGTFLPRVMQECMRMGHVTFFSEHFVVVRCGAVEVLIRHHLHAILMASTIDVIARVTCMQEDHPQRHLAAKQLWSVMSLYLTMIDYHLQHFQHLHVKLRIQCPGICATKSLTHTFAPCELTRQFPSGLSCPKCEEFQPLSEADAMVMIGRQRLLPMHDWIRSDHYYTELNPTCPYKDEDERTGDLMTPRRLCWHCGLTRGAVNKLWLLESTVYPASTTLSFFEHLNPGDMTLKENQGNVLRCAEDNEEEQTWLLRQPIFGAQGSDVDILVLNPGQISLIVAFRKTLYKKSTNSSEYNPEMITMDLNLATGLVKYRHDDIPQPDKQTELTVKAGDWITVCSPNQKYIAIEKRLVYCNILQIKKNGKILHEQSLPVFNYLAVRMKPEPGQASPALVLQCPTFPNIVSAHFTPGEVLFCKTGAGNVFTLARIVAIEDGRLKVTTVNEEEKAFSFSVSSPDIMPVSVMPSEFRILIDKNILKSQSQLASYLKKKDLSPAAHGLFTWFYHPDASKKFAPVQMTRGKSREPRACLFSPVSPFVLEASYVDYWNEEMNKNLGQQKYRTDNILLLPQTITHEFFISPCRQKVHDWTNVALYPVCRGRSNQSAVCHREDAHMVVASPYALSEEDFLSSYPYNLKILKLVTYQLFKYQGTIMPKWRDMLDEVNHDLIDDQQVQDRLREILHLFFSTFLLAEFMESRTERKTGNKNEKRKVKLLKFSMLGKEIRAEELNSQNKCKSHVTSSKLLSAKHAKAEMEDVLSHDYLSCVTILRMETGKLRDDWLKCLQFVPNLTSLSLKCVDVENIQGIGALRHLKVLDLEGNKIREIPDDLRELKDVMEELKLNDNPISSLPDFLAEFHRLKVLNLKNTLISSLPENIGDMVSLKRLDLTSTIVVKLPESFRNLKFLNTLHMKNIWWMEAPVYVERPIINRETYDNWFTSCQQMATLTEEMREEIFQKADVNSSGFISGDELDHLYKVLFDMFPRLGKDTDKEEDKIYGGFPPQIFDCRSLQTLDLGCQAIHFVPHEINRLERLHSLFLSDNPHLKSISAELGKLRVRVLTLGNCHILNTPPKEIVKQGMEQTIAYLKRLSAGSVACYRTKLMFVGLGGAGKTSLMRALMSHDFKTPHQDGEAITDGIDISTWTIMRNNQNLQYSVWDFAGQTLYYNTHQFFLSNRAVYLLVWNSRLGFEHSGVDFWLSSVSSHCPEAPIFVIGTHCDQVNKFDLPKTDLARRFPCIKAFHQVSSHTGQGVEGLLEDLINVTLQQPYIGEQIPETWLNFERKLSNFRTSSSILPWKVIKNTSSHSGIYGQELDQAIQFLHDLGALQHFDNAFLRWQVVINPQWIVDVMACIVSVHNKVIKEGVLRHSDIGVIWKNYPKNIHSWLISLTELFDLTFPLPDQPANIVPCLLPEEEPKIEWPEISDDGKEQELMMMYRFDYLPTGLFNRAQVRLYEYSSSSKMWKHGSLLEKNGHMALIKKRKESEVLVRAQGMRPENMLLLVHEVFEALIHESFRGVHYEYQLPCIDCIKANVKDPMMFSSAVLRRAINHKALFLQCHTYFHSLSITQIQTIMPPVSNNEYDLQLQSTMQDLENLKEDINADVFFLYSSGNVPGKSKTEQPVHPKKIADDLKAQNVKCWYRENMEKLKVTEIAAGMKSSKVILVLISNEFVADDLCQRMFHFAKDILKKDYILLMVGVGREWQQSELGMQVSEQVFINFQRPPQYKSKLQELREKLDQKLGTKELAGQESDVFISYCWVNSQIAAELGHARPKPGHVGWGDPRYIKQCLEENNISCWLDVERTGQTGLFEDIAEGLKRARLMIACVSDEYVLSSNCQMEFRFAHITLRLPIIVVVVGTGYTWESTEVGMLSLGYPKINLQFPNVHGYDHILEVVREKLETAPVRRLVHSSSLPQGLEDDDNKQKAFQELYELAQRKFLRQVSGYSTGKFKYPRLFVLDFDLDEDLPTDKVNIVKDGKPPPEESRGEGEDDIPANTENKTENEAGVVQRGDTLDDDQNVQVETEMKTSAPNTRKLKDGVPFYSQPFSVKVLCEYEGGWHAASTGFPVNLEKTTAEPLWKLVAPYMARILTILKHSSINLHIVNNEEGQKMISMLEKLAGSGADLDIKTVYRELIKFMLVKDHTGERGCLSRCHMPSGKELWLCQEHQRLPRVRVHNDKPFTLPDDERLQISAEEHLMHTLQSLQDEKKHGVYHIDIVGEDMNQIIEKSEKEVKLKVRRSKDKIPTSVQIKQSDEKLAAVNSLPISDGVATETDGQAITASTQSAEQKENEQNAAPSIQSSPDSSGTGDQDKRRRLKFETVGQATRAGTTLGHNNSQACYIL